MMSDGQGRRRARRGEGNLLREEILDATSELLLERGSEDAVSIEAIANAVGCTPPAIYLHFDDKRTLMLEVSKRYFGQLRARLEAVFDPEHPTRSLYRMGDAYVQFGLENPEAYRILFMQPGRRGKGDRATVSRAFLDVEAAVSSGLAAGNVEGDDPRAIVLTLWAAVHGITSLMIAAPDFPWPDDIVTSVLKHVGGGVARGPATATGRKGDNAESNEE
jgi:AcrR family transcriptional regulator